ncbi:MAG: hypothetical protein KDA57_13435 [Planctomycetales bacterium]|nr:hypothetical protein [Planctomycetales bacterium]
MGMEQGRVQETAAGQPQGEQPDKMHQAIESLIQALLLFAVIIAMTAIGFAAVRRYRGSTVDDGLDRSKLMSNFRELHAEGGLSDEEFRTIKTKLAGECKSELNGNSSNG